MARGYLDVTAKNLFGHAEHFTNMVIKLTSDQLPKIEPPHVYMS